MQGLFHTKRLFGKNFRNVAWKECQRREGRSRRGKEYTRRRGGLGHFGGVVTGLTESETSPLSDLLLPSLANACCASLASL